MFLPYKKVIVLSPNVLHFDVCVQLIGMQEGYETECVIVLPLLHRDF